MSVKLQQVQLNYRLRNHFGMRVTSLTPPSKMIKQGQLKQSLNQPSVYCFKNVLASIADQGHDQMAKFL